MSGCPIAFAKQSIHIARHGDRTHCRHPRPAAEQKLGCARAKNLTAFAAACGDNCTASFGRHALAKAVRLSTLPVVRLVCPLHYIPPLHGIHRPDAKTSDYRGVAEYVSTTHPNASFHSLAVVHHTLSLVMPKNSPESVDNVENPGLALVSPVDNSFLRVVARRRVC